MLNIRIVVASLFTFILLLGAMSYVTDRGYDKVMPQIEKQKQRIEEQKKVFSEYIQEDLKDLGATPLEYMQNMNKLAKEEFPEFDPGVRPLRPIGTWMGVRKGKENRIAIIKFDKKKYWLMIKDPVRGDITEKGKYDYQIVEIYFKPDNGKEYGMEYFMVSPNGFQLYGYDRENVKYTFEKSDNIKLDF